jgi:hypothetical protein
MTCHNPEFSGSSASACLINRGDYGYRDLAVLQDLLGGCAQGYLVKETSFRAKDNQIAVVFQGMFDNALGDITVTDNDLLGLEITGIFIDPCLLAEFLDLLTDPGIGRDLAGQRFMGLGLVGVNNVTPLVAAEQVLQVALNVLRKCLKDMEHVDRRLKSGPDRDNKLKGLLAIGGKVGGKKNRLDWFKHCASP